jgi:hypothetical protein
MVDDVNPAEVKRPCRALWDMERRLIALLGCGTAAVVFALLMAMAFGDEGPRRVELKDVAGLEVGTLVSVTGRISDEGVRGGSGFAIAEIVDGEGQGLRLFMSFTSPDIGPGDVVRAIGRVEVYEGTVEVVVSSPRDLEVIEGSGYGHASLTEVLASPWSYDAAGASVPVEIASPLVPDAGGSGWWCIVRDPADGDVRALALFFDEPMDHFREVGAEADLLVAPRYDGERGLVYLEVQATV